MNELKSLSYEELLCFMRSAPASIFLKDTQCKYRFVSNLCGLAHGGTTDGILGRTDLEIQADPALGREYYEDDLHVLATGQGSQRVSRLSLPTGPVYLEIKKNPVVLRGAVIGIIGVINDITQRVTQERELKELSFRDKLTGLYNRNYLETRIRRYVRSGDFPASLIMADCNYLKRVNDTLGHEYGDLMLQRVARCIQDLCPKCSSDQAAELIARIRRRLAARSDGILTLDVAFGSYTAQDDSLTFDQVFHRADRAMYENKKEMHRTPVQ